VVILLIFQSILRVKEVLGIVKDFSAEAWFESVRTKLEHAASSAAAPAASTSKVSFVNIP
jgi:hypothetical protein